MTSKKTLDISWETIFKIFIVVVCAYLIFTLGEILIWILFAIIISTLLAPTIDFWQKKRIPRIASISFIYIIIFGSLGLLIYLIITPFIIEIQYFAKAFPQYFEKFFPFLVGIGALEIAERFMIFLGARLEEIFLIPIRTIEVVLSILFVIAVSFFLSLEERPIQKVIKIIFPKKYEEYVLLLWTKCQTDIANWFWARILGCLFIGLVCYVVFLLLGVPYSLSLALIAGIFNFIPFIGPFISGIIILAIIALQSFSLAILALILFILIQQIENNIIIPTLMKKAVNISPAMVLIALAVGGTIWGIPGAILAVPLFGIVSNFISGYLKMKKQKQEEVIV